MLLNNCIFLTNDSPSVIMDHENHCMEIKGKSTLQNPVEFFSRLASQLTDYKNNNIHLNIINVHLQYINTVSSKWLFHIFKTMESMHLENNHMVINWYYDEDDEVMQEAGFDYSSLVQIPFNFIKVNSN